MTPFKSANQRKAVMAKLKAKKRPPIYALEDPESFGLNEKETIKLWQHGVNTGIVWKLQGWYGRNASSLIQAGIIKPAKKKNI